MLLFSSTFYTPYLLVGLPSILQGRGCSATQSFDFAQGHDSFALAQDRELVERPFGFAQGHEPFEWKLDFLRSHHFS